MAIELSSEIYDWEGIAFNTAPDSENKIHGDDLAQQYGFEGGSWGPFGHIALGIPGCFCFGSKMHSFVREPCC